tara:strand:+ start:13251 stop:14300 length:1050 start_codon:yes stop_codon:yes gene_type:complete
MAQKPVVDTSAFPEGEAPPTVEDRLSTGETVNLAEGGVSGTRPITPAISRLPGAAEHYIPGGPGAPHSAIVFGPQRNTNTASGQSTYGLPSDTIDLVAGMNAAGINEDGQIVGVNPITDAARVYITKAAQIDTMFGIAREARPDEEAEIIQSAAVMKADAARIIGRNGVKIITGRAQGVKGAGMSGERNSKGGKYQQAPTIDLIAGNNIESYQITLPDAVKPIMDVIKIWENWNPKVNYLQPLPRGENLLAALDDLGEMVQSIAGIQMTTMCSLAIWSATLSAAFAAGAGSPRVGMAAAAGATGYFCAKLPIKGITPDWTLKMQAFNWRQNYLNSSAERYILSRNVRGT